MADTNLRFDTPLNTTKPVDLRFGTPVSVVGDAYIYTVGTLPAPTLTANIAKVVVLTGSATLPAPMLSATLEKGRELALSSGFQAPTMTSSLAYDNAVYRGPNSVALNAWQTAATAHVDATDKTQTPPPLHAFKGQAWQDARALGASTSGPMRNLNPTRRPQASTWQDGIHAGARSGDSYADMLRLRQRRDANWQNGVSVRNAAATGWQDRFRYPRPNLVSPWTVAKGRNTERVSYAGKAMYRPMLDVTHWQNARRPLPGRSANTVPVAPAEKCYTLPPGGNVPFLFRDPVSTRPDLLFICDRKRELASTVLVPVKRTYIVLNDAHLIRVDGNIELPVIGGMSLNIDMDSWTWSFSATLPASSLSSVEPGVSGDKVLLKAVINGAEYMLLAEGIQRNRQFGKSTITVSGRGQSAELADPYSPILTFTNTADRTAQQLMNDALTVNGVSLGWEVDWRIEDWLVPSGAWSHQGSYMSAVNTIAAAAGALVQPDPVNKILRVRPRYPAKPWEWYSATPDLELPSSVIEKEGIQWTEKPAYNAVYVSGTTAGGVLTYVKRAGTAGDVMAPMISDALITSAAAGRQRAIPVLADTGRGALYSLSLPVLPETGIVLPGTLVRYVDNGNPTVGVIKGVSVNVSMPSVRQTIEVQTHG